MPPQFLCSQMRKTIVAKDMLYYPFLNILYLFKLA